MPARYWSVALVALAAGPFPLAAQTCLNCGGGISFGVSVTPDGGSQPVRASQTGGYTVTFTVTNEGTVTDGYGITCRGSSNVTCTSINKGSVALASRASTTVTATYSVTTDGPGTLTLTADDGGNASDNGSYNITVATFHVAVTPDGATAQQRLAETTGWTETFTVQNTGTGQDTYTFTCAASGQATCTGVSPATATLTPTASTTVSASYSVGVYGTGTLSLKATGMASDTGWYTVPVYGGPPVVDSAPYVFALQDYTRCAQECFSATYATNTVPYFSQDAARSVLLLYNSDRGSPRPFVLVNVTPSPTYPGTPTEYRLKAQLNGVTVRFVNGDSILRFTYPGTAPARLGGQFDASGYATGVYPMTITASALYGTSLFDHTVNAKLIVVNDSNSAVARGWTVGGVQRLYLQADGSALITEGNGSAIYFAKSGDPYHPFITPRGDFTNLTGTSGWVRHYPDGSHATFDATGRMTQIGDRFGNSNGVTYDASGRVSQLQDPQGLAITLNYGTYGLATIVDPMGRTTAVTVDASRRLTALTDPDNVSTSFGYDANSRLSSVTDRRGATTTFAYDAGWKLASVTAPSVQLFDGTTSSPVTTLAAWQEVGVPYTSTVNTAQSTVLAGAVQGRITDAGGHMTQFTVNPWGTPAQSTDALNRVTTTTFDSTGLPVRVSLSSGGVDTLAYDSNGLVTYIQPAGRSATTIQRGAYGLPTNTSGPGQPTVQNFIGGLGVIDSTITGGAAITKYTYDSKGRLLSAVDGAGHLLTQHTYAGTNGNLSRDSLPGNRMTSYLYDAYGRDTAEQRSGMPMRRTHHDLLNRVVQAYDGVNPSPTVTTYDSMYVRNVTDPKGQVYAFGYNALGWVTQRIDAAGHATLYAYDRDGLLRRFTNRRGDTLSYTYDALHRETSKGGRNTTSETWSYSVDGRTRTAASPVDTVTGFLSVAGLADSARTVFAGQTYWRRYRYTVAGLLDSIDVSGGGIAFKSRKYLYNTTLGALTEIHLGGAITRVGPNKDVQDSVTTFPGGDQVTRLYYPLHGVTQISTSASYHGAVDRSISYDSLGRITQQVLGSGADGDQYTYDGLGRLASDSAIHNQAPSNTCSGSPPPIIGPNGNSCLSGGGWATVSGTQFSYDPAGNRTDNGGSYVGGDRVTAFAGCTYTADADGNVTSRTCGAQTVTFFWSAESRLDSMTVGTTRVAFKYDAGGRLTRKDVNGAAQSYFLWDGSNLLAELGGTGTTEVAEYSYWGVDDLHAILVGGQEFNAHEDAIGNVTALTDGAGTLKRSYGYDAFGNLTGGSDLLPFSNADRARWKGALWLGPEVDLYYMRARWYEPKSGRFLSEDPAGLDGGLNPYTFAGSEPVNGTDPVGMMGGCLMRSQYVECPSSDMSGSTDQGIDWDAFFAEMAAESQPPSTEYEVTLLYNGEVVSIDMKIANADFDPTNPIQEALVEIAAEAAIDAGASSFTITSMTCCHSYDIDDPHNYGYAMDVVLGDHYNALQYGAFENHLEYSLPTGSQVLGPDGFGVNLTTTGIWPVNMQAFDRKRGMTLWQEHSGSHAHVHIQVPRGWVP